MTLLARLNAPVYLPVGELSPARCHAAARFLAGVARRAEAEIIPGRRHQNLMQARRSSRVYSAPWRASMPLPRLRAKPSAPDRCQRAARGPAYRRYRQRAKSPARRLVALVPHPEANIYGTFLRARA